MSNIDESSPKMNPEVIKDLDQTLSLDQDEDHNLIIDEKEETEQDIKCDQPSASPRTTATSLPSVKSEQSESSRPEKPATQLLLQPGDLAWARLGSAPFWPCVVSWNLDPKISNDEKCGDKEHLVQVRFHQILGIVHTRCPDLSRGRVAMIL